MFQKFILFISLFCATTLFSQSIVIDETLTAQQLVENVLINNSGCATVSGFSVSGGNFPAGLSYAKFDYSGTDFPFSEGIVLSTGRASNTQGPNNTLSDDDVSGWGTDSDLNAIFGNTINATVLEFDFTPVTDFISFEYLFASEEYQINDPNTCVFSDVFAFLIRPIGGNYTNIAVIPGTQIPVEVTTVRPEIPGACAAENEIYFGSFNNSSYQPINFNGMTTVLKAESNVIANTQYHIKLVIADHFNARFDSAVFLKANSFNVGTDLGVDRLINTNNALCNNETLTLNGGNAISYRWLKFNETTTLFDLIATGQFFTINSTFGSGRYKLEATLSATCIGESEIIVEYASSPTIESTITFLECFEINNSEVSYNLNDVTSDIILENTSLIIDGYYPDLPNAQAETNNITNSTNYPFTSQNETITVRIINNAGCVSFAEITLTAFKNPEIEADETIYYCINNFPDTITLESGIINAIGNEEIRWYNAQADLLLDYPNTASSPDLEINQTIDYFVTVENIENCAVFRKITVKPTSKAVLEKNLITENEFFRKASAIIEVSGLGNYQYAIDIDLIDINNDSVYQDSNVFENLSFGIHTLYVRDINSNNCETLIHDFIILDYPKFFTPNNDSINDYWNIDSTNLDTSLISDTLESQINTASDISIFDRIGRLVATINPKGLGWDGTFKGKPLPDSDYWFVVKYIDSKGKIYTKKGHFSLQI